MMTTATRTCAGGCGLGAAPGDVFCEGCRSAFDRGSDPSEWARIDGPACGIGCPPGECDCEDLRMRAIEPAAVSVVIATNVQGKIELFTFIRPADALRFAETLRGRGECELVLVRLDVEILDEQDASRLVFGVRGAVPR
jgi:hypothetical protein